MAVRRRLLRDPYAFASLPPPSGTDVLLEPFNALTSWAIAGSPAPTIVAARTGNGAQLTSFGGTLAYTIPAPSQSDTVIVGFAFKAAGLGSEAEMVDLSSDAGATDHIALKNNSAGALTVYRASSGIITTASGLIAAGVWAYIEIKAKLHDTTGTVEVRVNGVSVGTYTGDTKNAGTKTTFDTVKLKALWVTDIYDDLYITTGASAPFRGSITVP